MWQRLCLLLAAVLIGAAGFWLRFSVPLSPDWRDRSGGVAYVVFWIFVVAFLTPRSRPGSVALAVLLLTCLLEFAQLWHPPWLEAMRSTFIGRCVLGTTFGWDDFPPYFIGAAVGWAMLWLALRMLGRKTAVRTP